MSETQFFEALKQFCSDNKFELKYKFHVGQSIAIVIFGKDCIEPFDMWLSNWATEHSTPTSCDDGIISYVTL